LAFYETFVKMPSRLRISWYHPYPTRQWFCIIVELAGFPYHALDTYLPWLVRAGERVAICEQLRIRSWRKIVKRGIIEPLAPVLH
jgi:DNA mismatch repair ATPase MutS